MSLKQGRLGYVGLGIESTPGTPVAATTTLPFISNDFQAKHDPIKDISARGNRIMNYSSISGKKWAEGDMEVNVDTLNVGFLLKLALGQEIVNTVQTGVYDHLFYTTVSGNTPTTATLYNYQGVDVQQFSSVAVDVLDFEVKDELLTAKAGLKGLFPTTGGNAITSVSGTLIPFANYALYLGSNVPNALASSAIPVTQFMLSIKNNLEVIFESNSGPATRLASKGYEVTGSFTRYFESQTDRDNYYNLNKQSIVLVASGIGLPGSTTEKLTINLAKTVYDDQKIETGIDDYFAVQTNFTAEFDPIQGKQMDIVLRNYRSSAYT